jgi:hypothetical protein
MNKKKNSLFRKKKFYFNKFKSNELINKLKGYLVESGLRPSS